MKQRGFTLIELIIVIAIIAILASAIFVSLNPAQRFLNARDSQRETDLEAIESAVVKYQADNDGVHYSTVQALTAGNYYQIGTAASGCDSGCGAQTTQAACVNLSAIGSNYLATIPKDPLTGSDAETDYYLMKDSLDQVTFGVCDPDEVEEGGGGGGGGGTVICTELHRQGLLSDEMYQADRLYGAIKYQENPQMIDGYHVWAKPVVKMMQQSEDVTEIVAIIAEPWATQMAYEMGVAEQGSFVGQIMMDIGEPASFMIGKMAE